MLLVLSVVVLLLLLLLLSLLLFLLLHIHRHGRSVPRQQGYSGTARKARTLWQSRAVTSWACRPGLRRTPCRLLLLLQRPSPLP